MLFEGCQGNKGIQIQEKVCPGCGAVVELMSTDVSARCEECGFTVYSDLMECTQRCPKARECVGESYFARLEAARENWRQQMEAMMDEDTW